MYERKGNPLIDFLMVIMASGIAHGCIHTTRMTAMTKESCNVVAI